MCAGEVKRRAGGMRPTWGRSTELSSSVIETVIIPRSLVGGRLYYGRIISLVTSVYMPPVMLTKLNFVFILVDMPAEKQASSSWMYSLKVALCHLPIFWISRSEYPERDKRLRRRSEVSECQCARLVFLFVRDTGGWKPLA